MTPEKHMHHHLQGIDYKADYATAIESTKKLIAEVCGINMQAVQGRFMQAGEPPASILKHTGPGRVTAPKPTEPLRNMSFASHERALRGPIENDSMSGQAERDGEALARAWRY